MLVPCVAVGGAVFVIARLTLRTIVDDVDLSFSGLGSLVSELARAVFEYSVPAGEAAGMAAVMVNVAEACVGSVAMVHTIVPPAPGAGAVQPKVGPEFWVTETNVKSPGSVSRQVALMASFAPP